MSDTDEGAKTEQADYRLDLVRRLFAVAISIGVGAAIVNAAWVKGGRLPQGQEVEQIAIVLLALFATVLSWDGYLMSVRKKPLHDWPRFAIDVFLVFTYMFLIVTSNKSNFWLPIVCIMYTLYVFWDALSVLQFPKLFDTSPDAESRPKVQTLARVYFRAIGDASGIDRGPLISFVWAVYFFALLAITRKFPGFNVIGAVVSAALGMGLYRWDKAWQRNGVRGFSALERAAAIIGLLLAVVLFGCLSGAIHKS
jgi:hypothetical protein